MKSIKAKAKRIIDNNLGIKCTSKYKIPSDIDFISFDIFDTLVVRDVLKPTDVFKLLEHQNGIPEFANKRVSAEREARKNKESAEVNLHEIYASFSEIDSNKIEEFCNNEIDMEMSVCQPNKHLVDFYHKCLEKKKVILLSDMYMSAEQIQAILSKCGIFGYEKIYVSNEAQKSKANGSLYDYVAKDLGVDGKNVLHVGNDIKSDILNAKKHGFRALKIPMNQSNLLINKINIKGLNQNEKKAAKQLERFTNNHTISINDDREFYYKYGYENLGILLWGFCNWIYKSFLEEGTKQALFVARDGYIIKQAYDSMMLSKKIDSHYFEMSRRSIRVPSVFSRELTYHEMVENLPVIGATNIVQIFDAWGLDYKPYIDKIEKCGLNISETLRKKCLKDDIRIQMLYEVMQPQIISNAQAEKEMLMEYLKAFDFEMPTAIVDIGYNGTTQKDLIKLLDKAGMKSNITGYYMMLSRNARKNLPVGSKFSAKGYIFDNFNNADNPYEMVPFTGIFETFFLEQDGSVKKYIKKDNKIIAERLPFEYGDANEKGKNEFLSVKQLQKGAMDFVNDFTNSPVSNCIDINANVSFFRMKDSLCNPDSNMIKYFGEFRFLNVGLITYLASPKLSLFQYILHPRKWINEFYESHWRTGFLKAIFKLKLPYADFLLLRKKIYENTHRKKE